MTYQIAPLLILHVTYRVPLLPMTVKDLRDCTSTITNFLDWYNLVHIKYDILTIKQEIMSIPIHVHMYMYIVHVCL